MTKETKAVAVKKEAALAEANFLQEISGEFGGAINVRKELIKIPRLKLNQAMSDAVKGGLGKAGDFSCLVSGVAFGSSIKLIPLMVSESASLLDENSKPICFSKDLITNRDGVKCVHCPYGEYWNDWGTKESPKIPGCKTSIDMIVIVKHKDFCEADPMQLSFRKTSRKGGQKLLNLIVRDPKRIPFGSAYTIYSTEETNTKKQSYFTINPNKIDREALTLEELKIVYPLAKRMMDLKKQGAIDEEEIDLTDDAVEPREAEDPIPY